VVAPAYATDLTDITTDFTNNWNLITEGGGGQNAITAPERDDGIYDDGSGVVCVSRNPFSSSIRGIAYDRALITVATDDAVFYWWKADVAAALDSFANFGVRLCAGSTLTDYRQYGVAGNDTYAKGGWRCTPIDVTNAGDLDRGTPGTPNYDTFGIAFDLPGSGPSKGFPFKISMIRHGRSVDVTEGDSGDPATWAKLATHAEAGTRRWGIVEETDTGADIAGIVNWGTASTAVYSRDSNRAITFRETFGHVVAEFTKLVFANASTDIEWNGITFTALDATNRGVIEINSTDNPAVGLLSCVFTDLTRIEDGGSNTDYTGSTFVGVADQIVSNGGTFAACTFDSPGVAVDESAFVYNETADPGTILAGSSFVKGANAHHAIELGLSSPTSVTLDGVSFSGFGAAAANDATIYVKRTSGTVTINLTNGADTPTIKTDGATVNIQQSVTLTFTPLIAGSAITVARSTGQTVEYDNGNSGTSAAFAYNAATLGGVLVDITIMQVGSVPIVVRSFALPSTSQDFNVSQIDDTVFDNP
jgi:hypothetical protein